MDAKTAPGLLGNQPEVRLPWHKPQIQQIMVSLETQGNTGSNIDSFGGSEVPSDVRLKQDISGISNALQGILALHGLQELEQMYPGVVVARKGGFEAVNYALLVPVLAEAIKEQQAMIADLQAQVGKLH